MFNVTLELDPNVFDLKDLSPADRRQIKVSDLLTPGPKFQTESLQCGGTAFGRPCCLCERRRYIFSRGFAKPAAESQLRLREVARTETELVPDSASPVAGPYTQLRSWGWGRLT